jgi:hypothetical protein
MLPRHPDVFIVGAPRCGTTSMWRYLGEHPDIYMSPRKEPWFFCRDLRFSDPVPPTLDAYLAYFAAARDQTRVGEASAWYLFSREAAAAIKAFNPTARIIVMLRDPVAVMHSLHELHVYAGTEDITDFAEALRAEPERQQGRRLPRLGNPLEALVYHDVPRYAEQLERYLTAFGRDRVHIIVYDDLEADPDRVGQEVLRFLDVRNDHGGRLRVLNEGGRAVRQRWLWTLVRHPPAWLRWSVQHALPSHALRSHLLGTAKRLNTRAKPRAPLDPTLQRRLRQTFVPEVERLSALIDRDLTHWTRG